MDMSSPRLSVLARPAFSNAALNPYNATLYRTIEDYGIKVREYSILRAWTQRHHIVHVHWPESTFNHRLIEALPTTEALLRLLRRQRRLGARVLWTVHNLGAHDSRHPEHEARFWLAYLDLVDGFVSLQEGALGTILERFSALKGRPHWVVPHPHYRGRYPDAVDRATARAYLGIGQDVRTILFFGRIHPYKNVTSLISAFEGLNDRRGQRYRLVVAGAPGNVEIKQALTQQSRTDARIQLDLEYIAPDETQFYFRACDLVVLPYREILNSGSALLALSFDRPVLLPKSGCYNELVRAAGRPWVLGFDTLTAADLEQALDASAGLPERSDGTHLTAFAQEQATAAMARAYRELVAGQPD